MKIIYLLFFLASFVLAQTQGGAGHSNPWTIPGQGSYGTMGFADSSVAWEAGGQGEYAKVTNVDDSLVS